MEHIEFTRKPFLSDYKLERNSLHPGWQSLMPMLRRGKGWCLDIGCGDGHHREDIRGQGYKWIGCDINQEGIENYVLADALCLPFKSNSIDVVFSNCVLE